MRVLLRPPAGPELLFVDDEPAIRSLVAAALGRRYRVTTAADGREAAALIQAEPGRFSAILSDIAMPEMSGLELVRWIGDRHPDLVGRVGLVTGSRLEPDDEAFVARSTVPCLSKPFSLGELLAFATSLTKDERSDRPAEVA